jgi:hypothetical protein
MQYTLHNWWNMLIERKIHLYGFSERTNTTATQQCYRQLDTSRQRYIEEQDKGQHSRENKRKMAREEDVWTIATQLK